MKNVSEVENVIKVDFNSSVNSNEISHPASKNFPLEDDPLAQLLADYDIDEDIEEEEEAIVEDKFDRLSFETPLMQMCDEVTKRIEHLKKSSQRLKYYLDESYID